MINIRLKAGEHTFCVDQPLPVGGTDTGASPVEYLFASLAGCIVTTARIIATQKKLNLYGMDIKIEGSVGFGYHIRQKHRRQAGCHLYQRQHSS